MSGSLGSMVTSLSSINSLCPFLNPSMKLHPSKVHLDCMFYMLIHHMSQWGNTAWPASRVCRRVELRISRSWWGWIYIQQTSLNSLLSSSMKQREDTVLRPRFFVSWNCWKFDSSSRFFWNTGRTLILDRITWWIKQFGIDCNHKDKKFLEL